MASQAQKNTISLKGSSKMICDFLDYGTVNTLRFVLEFHALKHEHYDCQTEIINVVKSQLNFLST